MSGSMKELVLMFINLLDEALCKLPALRTVRLFLNLYKHDSNNYASIMQLVQTWDKKGVTITFLLKRRKL